MASNDVKRVLCVHDLASVGRCSLAVASPVLSALGAQACLLPTALLSTHTGGFGAPAMEDASRFCGAALEHFCALSLSFDATYSGYLAQAEQVQLVLAALAQNPQALTCVDPVMGDGGKLYSAITPQLCKAMLSLCAAADVLTPNVTESAVLLGLPPCDDPMTAPQWRGRAAALAQQFPKAFCIVITGVAQPQGGFGNVLYSPHSGEAPQWLAFTRANSHYPGTGDLFTATLLGYLLQGRCPKDAVDLAAHFVATAASATLCAQTDPRFGVQFEPLLHLLTQQGHTV